MSFGDFFVVRLLWAVFGLWLAVTVVFVTTRVLASPAEVCKFTTSQVACEQTLVEQLDRGDPIHERYLHFVRDLVVHQSPGGSLSGHGPDAGRIARHALPATASLVTGALVFALALAAAAGIGWSRVARKWDRLLRVPIYVAVGLSPVVLGLWLSYYVGFRWGLTPVTGYCDLVSPPADSGCGGARDWLSHLVLPAVTLGLYFAGIYTRVVRAGVADIRRAPGEKERRDRRRRFVLVMARAIGRDFGWVIGVAVFVEVLFGIPGLGRITVLSVSGADLVLLEAAVLYAAFLGIAVHFVVDLIVGALDPDLRAEWPVAGMPKPT